MQAAPLDGRELERRADVVAVAVVRSGSAAQRDVGDGDGSCTTGLATPEKFAGYRGEPPTPEAILLSNNGLHDRNR